MKFQIGQLVITPPAEEVLSKNNMNWSDIVGRHVTGDWGVLDPEDAQSNEDALKSGGRLLSNYIMPITKEKVWIITEWDRSATTILLPSDY